MFFWKSFFCLTFGLTVSTQVTFVAGPLAPANCSIAASNTTVVADGTSTTTLTIRARDIYNNPVVTSVSLAGSGGNNNFGTASSNTDPNGQFVTTLASTQVQTETITATLGGSINPNLTVTFIVGPAASAQSSLVLNPTSQTADNANVITATLTLKDAQAHPISGVTPTFSATGSSTTISASTATNASGQSSVTYKTSLAQTENANVTVSGFTLSQQMIFVAGPPTQAASTFSISPNNLLANGSAQATLLVNVRDAQGNPVNAKTVSIAGSGGNNTFATQSGTSNTSGVWSTTLKSTQVQTETITTTINGNVTETATVTFTVGPATSATSSLTVSPSSVVADNTATITATLTLKDAQAHPITGVTPSFAASGNSTTISGPSATNALGQSAVTYKSTLAQNENATASASGLNFTSAISFTPGPASATYSTVTATPSNLVADGNTRSSINVHLADAYNNSISAQRLGFFSSGGAGPFLSSGIATDTLGNASNKIVSFARGSSKIIVNAGGVALSATLTSTAPTPYCTGNPNYQIGQYGTATAPFAIVTGDWNGDGRVDFAYADNTNKLVVYTDSGGYGFAAGASYTVCSAPQILLASDMNGDGNLDLAMSCSGNSVVQVLYGTGSATFTTSASFATGYGTNGLVLADFDGDGRVDLAASSVFGNNMSVYMNAGGTSMSNANSLSTGVYPRGIGAGDFNGDGMADLVATNSNDMTLSVFLATGGGNFANQVTYAVGSSPWAVAVGDFDNNNKLDLAVVNQGSNTVSVLLGTGTGTFNAQTQYTVGSGPSALAVSDFNGDAYLDLLVANTGTNTYSMLKGNGSGAFAAQVSRYAGSNPQSVATGLFFNTANVYVDFIFATPPDTKYFQTLYNACD